VVLGLAGYPAECSPRLSRIRLLLCKNPSELTWLPYLESRDLFSRAGCVHYFASYLCGEETKPAPAEP
jgi:hypothetical protein